VKANPREQLESAYLSSVSKFNEAKDSLVSKARSRLTAESEIKALEISVQLANERADAKKLEQLALVENFRKDRLKIKDLESRVNTLRDSIESKNSSLQESDSLIASINQTCIDLNTKILSLEGDELYNPSIIGRERREANLIVNNLTLEFETLLRRRQVLEMNLNYTQLLLEFLNRSSAVIPVDNIESKERTFDQMLATLQSLEKDMNGASDQQAVDVISQLKQGLDVLGKGLNQVKQKDELLKRRVEELTNSIQEIQSRLDTVKASIDVQNLRIRQLDDRLSDRESRLQELRSSLESEESQLKPLLEERSRMAKLLRDLYEEESAISRRISEESKLIAVHYATLFSYNHDSLA
jgi:predicted nuclease with TOPRIM domain